MSPSLIGPEFVRRDVGKVRALFCTCFPNSKGKHILKYALTSILEVSEHPFRFIDSLTEQYKT